jgi:hypothetical protein
MESKSLRAVQLETELALLKKEEERFRYLVTGVKTSDEYRREAMAKLEDTRRKIHLAQVELKNVVGYPRYLLPPQKYMAHHNPQ